MQEERTATLALLQAQFAGTRPYRRTSPRGKYLLNGRVVKPGEVVMLTYQQAQAFADGFEPATEGVHQ
jgi:hypothetical protein